MDMQKLFSFLLLTLIMGVTFITNGKTSQKHPSEIDSQTLSIQKVMNLPADIPKEQAQQIVAAYLEVKDALVQTNGTSASVAAAKLVETLGGNKDDLIEKIRTDAKHIAGTEDAEEQREHFNSLSDNVYALIKATGANESPIYLQYCPMAFENEGAYWLAAEEEVNNPYFGDMMLHCGSVEKEL